MMRRATVLRADSQQITARVRTSQGWEQVYKPTSWLCGYISVSWWKTENHGWRDPHIFLRRHAQRNVP
ncbi:hypothetical protein CCP2SC5_120031 [Azospirillaceae bacterium]